MAGTKDLISGLLQSPPGRRLPAGMKRAIQSQVGRGTNDGGLVDARAYLKRVNVVDADRAIDGLLTRGELVALGNPKKKP